MDKYDSDTYSINWLMTWPKGFSKHDPERIKLFAERLCALRENASQRAKEGTDINGSKYCGSTCSDIKTQAQLAKKLGVSVQWVSNYEKGRKKSIPMEKLPDICSIYDATPHYVLGYTSSPDLVLSFDKDGNVECDDDGKYIELKSPFTIPEKQHFIAEKIFNSLSFTNPKRFKMLCNLLTSPEKHQKIYFSVLEALYDSL